MRALLNRQLVAIKDVKSAFQGSSPNSSLLPQARRRSGDLGLPREARQEEALLHAEAEVSRRKICPGCRLSTEWQPDELGSARALEHAWVQAWARKDRAQEDTACPGLAISLSPPLSEEAFSWGAGSMKAGWTNPKVPHTHFII